MNVKTFNRREFLERCITAGLLVGAPGTSQAQLLAAASHETMGNAAKATPPTGIGPFFKKGSPNRTNLRVAGEAGLPLSISGRILDTRGEPVHDAQIELWHADQQGIYDSVGFRYRAKLALANANDYTVETIMPGHYASRPVLHVHYLITAPGCKPLVTQLFFATDPYFEGDPEKNFDKNGRGVAIANRDCIRPVSLLDLNTAPRTAVIFDLVLEKS